MEDRKMCHKGQKILNKTASMLRGNEFDMYGYFITSTKNMRKYVKREKLHYTEKMVNKAKQRGKW